MSCGNDQVEGRVGVANIEGLETKAERHGAPAPIT